MPPSGIAVRVDSVDVSGLCDAGLRARLRELGRADSALTAMKAAALGEIARRKGASVAEHAAKDTLSISGRAARGDVKAAMALSELDATRKGLASGLVPAGHAQLIARAATEGPIDEGFLAQRAQQEGYDEFRRTVARHVAEQSSDDGASVLEQQRQARAGRVFTSRGNGMVVLNAQFDSVTGARLATVIAAMERHLYHHEDPAARPSHPQRAADAIAKLILEPDAQRPAGTSLLVVADYDMVNHQLTKARLSDGTPIPPHHRMAGRRPHRLRQPRVGLQPMPRQDPPRRLRRQTQPQHRPLPAPAPDPATPVTVTARPAGTDTDHRATVVQPVNARGRQCAAMRVEHPAPRSFQGPCRAMRGARGPKWATGESAANSLRQSLHLRL